jgi:hypothetical protein
MALEDVRIARPCGKSWDDMFGDGPVRFCRHCEQHVHDLSRLSRDEAEALLARRDVCVRVPKRRKRALAVLAVGACLAASACTPDRPPRPAEPRVASVEEAKPAPPIVRTKAVHESSPGLPKRSTAAAPLADDGFLMGRP